MAPQCFWCSLCRLGGVARLLLSTTCSVPVHDKGSLSQVLPKSLLALQDTLLKIAIKWEVHPEAQQAGTEPQPLCLTRWCIFCRPGRGWPQSNYDAKTGKEIEQKRRLMRLKSCDRLTSAHCFAGPQDGWAYLLEVTQAVKTDETPRRHTSVDCRISACMQSVCRTRDEIGANPGY